MNRPSYPSEAAAMSSDEPAPLIFLQHSQHRLRAECFATLVHPGIAGLADGVELGKDHIPGQLPERRGIDPCGQVRLTQLG
jgi:hypothetical protein